MDEWLRGLVSVVAGLWLASLSWVAKRQVDRIDRSVSKDELAQALRRIDEHMTEAAEVMNRHLLHDEAVQARIFDKLDTLTQWVSELRGALNGLPQKHS